MRTSKFIEIITFCLFLVAVSSAALSDTVGPSLAETSVAHLAEGRWQPVIDSVGDALKPDGAESQLLGDIFRAAVLLAPATEQSKLSQKLPTEDWLTKQLADVNEASALKADPSELSLEDLRKAAAVRKSIQNAAFSGRPNEIVELIDNDALTSDFGPASESLLAYAKVMRNAAEHFADSEMSQMYSQIIRSNDQASTKESHRDAWLGDFRADPESAETPRGDDNEYSVMMAKEAAKAALVESYSKLYTAYRQGELTRAQALREMAALDSDLLNNYEKRVLLYWKLRELKQEHQLADRQKMLEKHKDRLKSQEEQIERYKTLSWPTIFSHPDLSADAIALQRHLTQYTQENSGPLSACYAKCSGSIRSLCQTLEGNLPGIPTTQRAELTGYLRTLLSEVAAPYSSDGYIARLQLNDFSAGNQYADRPSEAVNIPAGLLSAEIDLNNEAEVASYAVCRSLLTSMLLATRAGDQQRLQEIAKRIQASGLLVAQHKAMLNQVGSSLYKQASSSAGPDSSTLDELEVTLASLSGADGASLVGMNRLSDQYQAEAFETLINHLVSKTDG